MLFSTCFFWERRRRADVIFYVLIDGQEYTNDAQQRDERDIVSVRDGAERRRDREEGLPERRTAELSGDFLRAREQQQR